ncbi:MAG: AbrB/MazE/SpoVT family DNA-binding domain-containing protein [Thermofilum sp.]|nr:AbrB/MazE/SpoVT family DNA-binding domain-containing protein [Thermofilum sp.]
MKRSKITRSFQVTIPKEIREALGLQIGDYLNMYVDEKGRIIMEKKVVRRKTFRAGRPLTPEEIDEIIAKGLGENIAGGGD